MRILISVDLEGISGVVGKNQIHEEGSGFEWARNKMAKEVNHAIEGALEGGAREIYVNDAHGSMKNIIPDKLHSEAFLISGDLKELSMVEGLQKDVHGLFLIGYHARRGTKGGILDHTYSGRVVSQITINGVELGETGINALVAGAYGVPVLLITGDDKVCQEGIDLLGDVYTVKVKEGLSRYAAICLHPEKAGKIIKEKAREAVTNINRFKPFVMDSPYELRVEVVTSAMADGIEMVPGIKRISPTTLEFVHEDLITLFKVLRVMLVMGGNSS